MSSKRAQGAPTANRLWCARFFFISTFYHLIPKQSPDNANTQSQKRSCDNNDTKITHFVRMNARCKRPSVARSPELLASPEHAQRIARACDQRACQCPLTFIFRAYFFAVVINKRNLIITLAHRSAAHFECTAHEFEWKRSPFSFLALLPFAYTRAREHTQTAHFVTFSGCPGVMHSNDQIHGESRLQSSKLRQLPTCDHSAITFIPYH